MKKYICTVCEYIYDPAQGDPESGIEPGTAFEDIPDDWTCGRSRSVSIVNDLAAGYQFLNTCLFSISLNLYPGVNTIFTRRIVSESTAASVSWLSLLMPGRN